MFSIHVLMVEDNPGDARLVQELLRDTSPHRFMLHHVASISEARQMAEHASFDVILLDLSLPDSQGLESLDALQGLAREMPIVIVSGNDDESLAAETFVRGAQDFLLKNCLDGYWLDRCLLGAMQRHDYQLRLRDLSSIDELTGLHNRRGFMILANVELARCRRVAQCLAVYFLDMDGLKRINDTHGHLAGDRTLRDMALLIRQSCRETDILARIGGDEFALLVTGPQSTGFDQTMTRLQQRLIDYNRSHAIVPLAISHGSAHYDPQHPQSVEDLLADADALMYQHKHGKKSPDADKKSA